MPDRAAALTREQAVRAVEHELDYLCLSLAVFAPHGFDSSRPGDYDFAHDARATLERLKAAWEVVRDSSHIISIPTEETDDELDLRY